MPRSLPLPAAFHLALSIALLLVASPSPAVSQQADSVPTDTIFLRAQRLVAEGQGDAGRALVAQRLTAATPGTPGFVEALYWRGVLAATAADAERDYKRIIIEFPVSHRAEDALLRLAQLELARGDRAQAMQHLERLILEHPDGRSHARASYWMARVLIDDGKTAAACTRLADAARSTPEGDVELRNQIEYQSQRCVGVDTTGARVAQQPSAGAPAASRPAVAPPPAAAPAPAPAPAPVRPVARPQFTVQLGAFNTRPAALEMQARLRQRGVEARIVTTDDLHRVRVGRYPSREGAEQGAARLRSAGFSAFVTEAEAP
ncbi:MAG: SPOR domain-containing protein [Gemmatimonadaceae bacterium]